MPMPMPTPSALLIAAAAALVSALGALHLLYTFHGDRLHPRDPTLQARMREVSPGIARGMSMWDAWIGFNASHGLGALLFGAVYVYLPMSQWRMLSGSPFLLTLGGVFLAALALVARAYWFRIPHRALCLAGAAYSVALVLRWA